MKTLLAAALFALPVFAQTNEAVVNAPIFSFDTLRIYEAYQLGSAIEVVRVESDFLIASDQQIFSDPFPLNGPTIAITKIQSDSDFKFGGFDENGNFITPSAAPIPDGAIPLSRRSQWPVGGDWNLLGIWTPDLSSPWIESPEFGDLHLGNYPWVWWYDQARWIYVTESIISNRYNTYWLYIPTWGTWFYSSKEYPDFIYSWEQSQWLQVP